MMTDFAGDSDEGYYVAVQPDGKTIVSGYATINDAMVAAMARYNRTMILVEDHEPKMKVWAAMRNIEGCRLRPFRPPSTAL